MGREPSELPRALSALLTGRAVEYRDRARRFQCLETSRHEKASRDEEKVTRRRYLLERDPGGAVYRALRGKPGRRSLSADSPFPFPEPFAWTQMFEPALRSHFRFEADEATDLDGRPALPVRFEAGAPVEEGRGIREWSGTVWVHPATGDILRVAARPNFQEEALAEAYLLWKRKLRIRWENLVFARAPAPRGREIEVEFRQEHEGLLYPSRVELRVFRMTGPEESVPHSRVVVEYDRYEFFRSEAAAAAGEPEAPPAPETP